MLIAWIGVRWEEFHQEWRGELAFTPGPYQYEDVRLVMISDGDHALGIGHIVKCSEEMMKFDTGTLGWQSLFVQVRGALKYWSIPVYADAKVMLYIEYVR